MVLSIVNRIFKKCFLLFLADSWLLGIYTDYGRFPLIQFSKRKLVKGNMSF